MFSGWCVRTRQTLEPLAWHWRLSQCPGGGAGGGGAGSGDEGGHVSLALPSFSSAHRSPTAQHRVWVVRVGGEDGELRPWHCIYVYGMESRLIMRVRWVRTSEFGIF